MLLLLCLAPSCSFSGSAGLSPGPSDDGGAASSDGGLADARQPASVDPEVQQTDAMGDGKDPAIAFGTAEFGLAWGDDRSGTEQIHFARVATDGSAVGSDLAITTANGDSKGPAIAWSGTHFGIVWEDERDGNREIYFAAMSPDGTVATAATRVTDNNNSSDAPSLAWNGSAYGVSWTDNREGNDEIYFALLDTVGTVLAGPTAATNNAAKSDQSVLTWTGAEFGLSWTDDRDGDDEIFFARLNAAGVKQGGNTIVTATTTKAEQSSIAWTGTEFVLAWEDERNGNGEIYAARIDDLGVVVNETRITTAVGNSRDAIVLSLGSQLGLAWSRGEGDDVYYIGLAQDLSPIAPEIRTTTAASASDLSAAVGGDAMLLGWSDGRVEDNDEIFVQRISP